MHTLHVLFVHIAAPTALLKNARTISTIELHARRHNLRSATITANWHIVFRTLLALVTSTTQCVTTAMSSELLDARMAL
jgi:hypothetical protein